MKRPIPLTTGHIYHIYNKSIYGYAIFNSPKEYERMLHLIRFYQKPRRGSFSNFSRCIVKNYPDFSSALAAVSKNETAERVVILAYCLMPTHIHFILEQKADEGITSFMKDIQSGYTQYFNLRHNRKGPLWQGRFGNGGDLHSEEKLREKIDYVHNNPIKDLGLKHWAYSSTTSPLPGSVEVIENPTRPYNKNLCRHNSS